MGKTIDVAEAARLLGVDTSRVRVLCRQRRIPGARLVGRVWMIPEDLRVTPGTRGPALTRRRK
jgi:excisionase family DNA binding protein